MRCFHYTFFSAIRECCYHPLNDATLENRRCRVPDDIWHSRYTYIDVPSYIIYSYITLQASVHAVSRSVCVCVCVRPALQGESKIERVALSLSFSVSFSVHNLGRNELAKLGKRESATSALARVVSVMRVGAIVIYCARTCHAIPCNIYERIERVRERKRESNSLAGMVCGALQRRWRTN